VIPPRERKPVLRHGTVTVVPTGTVREFLLLYDENQLQIDQSDTADLYNNVGRVIRFVPNPSPVLEDLYDVLGVLFLWQGYESTRKGSLLEEMKQIIKAEKLERLLTDPYTVRPQE